MNSRRNCRRKETSFNFSFQPTFTAFSTYCSSFFLFCFFHIFLFCIHVFIAYFFFLFSSDFSLFSSISSTPHLLFYLFSSSFPFLFLPPSPSLLHLYLYFPAIEMENFSSFLLLVIIFFILYTRCDHVTPQLPDFCCFNVFSYLRQI